LEPDQPLLFHAGAALDEHERTGAMEHRLRFRTLAPVVKYRAGEQDVDFARAAVEMLGGNGYVADFGVARLLRDAQVNPIWEGTSNICALDLWRAIEKQHGHQPVLRHAEQLLATVRTERARRLADTALRGVADVQEAIAYLAGASRARQDQQARRLADLFGDVVALCVLAVHADHDIRRGNRRTALLGELFARRLASAHTRRDAVIDAFEDVCDLYPALFGEESVSERLAIGAAGR
jgi:acyl-CoA dehydrogenase